MNLPATHAIDKIYLSGGEEDIGGKMGELRHATLRLLDEGGIKAMPPALRQEITEHLLQFVNLTKIDEAQAYLFQGRLDVVSLFLLYFLADRAQSNMPDAMLRNPNGTIPKAGEEAVQKPIVLINTNGEHDLLIDRLASLMFHGGAKRHFSEIIKIVKTPEEARDYLHREDFRHLKVFTPSPEEHEPIEGGKARPGFPKLFVCCGFSITGDYLEAAAEETARVLADDFDFITGGGRGGLMKRFQKAAVEAGAHVTGITFPELNPIARHHGMGSLAHGVSKIVGVKNMAKRMEKMIKRAEGDEVNRGGLLVLPGGLGTDNETIGPMLMKVLGGIDQGVPILLQNLSDPERGGRYHDTLIALLKDCGFKEGRDFNVISPDLVYDNAGKLDMQASARVAAEATRDKFRELLQRPVRSAQIG